ncbi:putative ribonuclease H-like domain-containing protein [Tanacetum coccineum]
MLPFRCYLILGGVTQMDVKSAFLYGTIKEDVYVCQPPGFEDSQFPDKVSMIGSLMYLTASRPDITFAVCACARDSKFDLKAFLDSDYAGASLDRKSTTGGCQFLGKRLISWQCKKQTIVANSTTEAEYVAAANCCGQVLWIQNQMLDYGFNFMNTKIYIDNESTICVVKNLVFHSKTKHIEIRHHFIRDSYEKRLIQVFKDGFDGCIGLKMLFGPVLRVKHGKKLVSAARLALCCWAKVSTVRHRVSAARQNFSNAGLTLEKLCSGV